MAEVTPLFKIIIIIPERRWSRELETIHMISTPGKLLWRRGVISQKIIEVEKG